MKIKCNRCREMFFISDSTFAEKFFKKEGISCPKCDLRDKILNNNPEILYNLYWILRKRWSYILKKIKARKGRKEILSLLNKYWQFCLFTYKIDKKANDRSCHYCLIDPKICRWHQVGGLINNIIDPIRSYPRRRKKIVNEYKECGHKYPQVSENDLIHWISIEGDAIEIKEIIDSNYQRYKKLLKNKPMDVISK